MVMYSDNHTAHVGRELLERIGGPDFDASIKRLAEFSQDLADLTVGIPYGEVLSRPGLALPVRQACTVAVLLANGSAQGQLRFHMDGLLNVGGSVDELIELLTLATGLLGFPSAINGIGVLREIVKRRGIAYQPEPVVPADGATRFETGLAAVRALIGINASFYTAAFAAVSPELARWTIEFEFGDVIARGRLDRKTTHLALILMLATSGNRADLLRLHITGALRNGVTQDEIAEAIIQLAVYAGFPIALNTAFAAIEAPRTRRQDGPGPAPETAPASVEADDDRRSRGLRTLRLTSGDAGDAVVHSFDDLAQHIGASIVDHSYGDISRVLVSIQRHAN